MTKKTTSIRIHTPFEKEPEQPNEETIAAMLDAERIAKDLSVKGYNNLDELFAELKR